jgi:hypothetical protein
MSVLKRLNTEKIIYDLNSIIANKRNDHQPGILYELF